MKSKKKIVYALAVISIIFCGILFSNATIYASEEVIASGDCGDDAIWELYSDGDMIISGTGAMWDMYTDEGDENAIACPWINYRTKIKTITIESGIATIGSAAFRDCIDLTKVNLPNTLKEINLRAFWGCKSLETCRLPEGLEYIEERIFFDCDSLTSVTIPNTVNFLGLSICEDCDNLTYLYIGGTNETFFYTYSSTPIGYCPLLEKIEVSEKNIALKSIDGVLYSKDGSDLIEYPAGKKDQTYYVADETKKISRFAFNQIDNIEELVLPEGLLEVEAAFIRECDNLSSLVLPSTLIKSDPFGSIVSCDNIVYIENKSETIFALDKLTENTLWLDETGKKITEIGKGKAYQYRPVYDISLPQNIQLDVGETVTVPESITYWNPKGKKNYKDLIYISSNPSVATVSEDGIVTAISNGFTTLTIKPRFFRSLDKKWEKTCTVYVGDFNIENADITLPKSSYDYNGKAKTPNVNVKLNGTTLTYGKDYQVTYANNVNIGTAEVTITGINNYTGTITKKFTIEAKKGADFTTGKYKYEVIDASSVRFKGITSSSMKKVTIPKTVKYGGASFKVTEIAKNALKNKTKVTTVVIGVNVKTIGVSAFEGCKKLTKVTIGSAVTTIEDKAFKNCTALKSVTIPNKVKKIDKQAFYGCKKIKTITIKSTKLKTVGKDAFKKINSKATIKVPKSKLKSYKKLLKNKGQGSKVKIVKIK